MLLFGPHGFFGPQGLGGDLGEALVALVAVATLPLGILAAIFLGVTASAVVFVVGWFLLVPVLAIVQDALAGGESAAGEANEDPLETLRERYAAGEIDRGEFERRVEDLVATEDVDVDPERELSESLE